MDIAEDVEADLFGGPMDQEDVEVDPGPPRNRNGHEVHRGLRECNRRRYCGQKYGRDVIPGSDGRCGPTNGPQCEACKVYTYYHPVEDQLAHLAMKPGERRKAVENPVRAQVDFDEDYPSSESDDNHMDEDATPEYPEDLVPEVVDRLAEKHYPVAKHVV